MPATIIVAHGLVHPLPWCGPRFPAMGQRVKTLLFFCPPSSPSSAHLVPLSSLPNMQILQTHKQQGELLGYYFISVHFLHFFHIPNSWSIFGPPPCPASCLYSRYVCTILLFCTGDKYYIRYLSVSCTFLNCSVSCSSIFFMLICQTNI